MRRVGKQVREKKKKRKQKCVQEVLLLSRHTFSVAAFVAFGACLWMWDVAYVCDITGEAPPSLFLFSSLADER